jgi:D-glycero-alpha-D-manno-heptose 1-phosphate guanylyltransferase
MKAIILAGGFGTRLRERVPLVPKPMAPVAGRPFLEYILDKLDQANFEQVVLSVGYQASIIMDHFGDSYRHMSISYAHEKEPLGTGGAIAFALTLVDEDPVLVINGDTFLDIDYRELFNWYLSEPRKVAIVLRELDDISRYGTVQLKGDIVTGFYEKGQTGAGLINAGVYIVNPNFFDEAGVTGKFSFEVDFLQVYCDEIKPGAYIVSGYFIDIGIPDDYNRAQYELPKL